MHLTVQGRSWANRSLVAVVAVQNVPALHQSMFVSLIELAYSFASCSPFLAEDADSFVDVAGEAA